MNYIIPVLIFCVILSALIKKTPVYSSFVTGAADGLRMLTNIFPAMAAIITASYMLRASGALDMLGTLLDPLLSRLGISADVLPLILMRPVSGSGSLGLLTDIVRRCGADSEAGTIASVITGSTETTFYCICVYFADTRVRHTAKVIPCALIGDAVGMAAGIAAVKLLF